MNTKQETEQHHFYFRMETTETQTRAHCITCKHPDSKNPICSPVLLVIQLTREDYTITHLSYLLETLNLFQDIYIVLDLDEKVEMVKFREFTGDLQKKHGFDGRDKGRQQEEVEKDS